MKRQLSDKEKGICLKMIGKFEKEMQHLRFLVRYYDLMIGEGCYWNYLERLKENQDLKKGVIENIQDFEFKIRTLREQSSVGVEMKEEKVEVEEGKLNEDTDKSPKTGGYVG